MVKNRRYRPLICAEVVYFLLFIAELTFSVLRSGHHLVYPLDDTYITMAMAKHFAQHGVWGVTPFAFTSATSTPLYVLLLSAAYCLAGVADWLKISIKDKIVTIQFGQLQGLHTRADWDPMIQKALTFLPEAQALEENAHKVLAQKAIARNSAQ